MVTQACSVCEASSKYTFTICILLHGQREHECLRLKKPSRSWEVINHWHLLWAVLVGKKHFVNVAGELVSLVFIIQSFEAVIRKF